MRGAGPARVTRRGRGLLRLPEAWRAALATVCPPGSRRYAPCVFGERVACPASTPHAHTKKKFATGVLKPGATVKDSYIVQFKDDVADVQAATAE